MNSHWKIFNVINIICLTLIVGFISWNLYQTPFTVERPSDNFFYVIIFLIIAVVTINCLHNVFLTKLYAAGDKMKLGRKILFWILLLLFATLISFFSYLTYVEIDQQLKPDIYPRNYRLKYLLQFLSISATGLYIIGAQLILFFRIRRSYRQRIKNTINEIGS